MTHTITHRRAFRDRKRAIDHAVHIANVNTMRAMRRDQDHYKPHPLWKLALFFAGMFGMVGFVIWMYVTRDWQTVELLRHAVRGGLR